MHNIYLGLKFAFSYFSILPISFKQSDDLSNKEVLKYTILFLPLVGLFLSSGIVLVYSFLENSWFNAILFSVLYMIAYGFIHTEAISDVMDAVYASHSGKDPYEVIKEPTIGAMGMLYSVAWVILKVSALSFVLYGNYFLEFIFITMISRLMVVWIVALNSFKSSFVNMIKKNLTISISALFTLFYSLVAFSFLGFSYIYLLVLAIVVSYMILKYLDKRLGFYNGDVLGFSIETIEIVLLSFLINFTFIAV